LSAGRLCAAAGASPATHAQQQRRSDHCASGPRPPRRNHDSRDRLRRDAASYLEPDEQIQAVFYAKRPAAQANDRAVVATDRRLLLLKLNFLGRVTGLLGEAQRETRLGPCHGMLSPIRAFDTPLQVSFRFFKDVSEADRAAGFSAPESG
jgi:hypothetical protein